LDRLVRRSVVGLDQLRAQSDDSRVAVPGEVNFGHHVNMVRVRKIHDLPNHRFRVITPRLQRPRPQRWTQEPFPFARSRGVPSPSPYPCELRVAMGMGERGGGFL
jgi:hypothetical protein